MVIFRENTEDVYAGYEVQEGTPEARKLTAYLRDEMGWPIRDGSGIGIKPISEMGSKRLIRAAIKYALEHGRDSVTLVHKGNIQKFTEGAFQEWGYELVREEFADVAVGWNDCGGDPGDKLLVKDSIADITLQQVLTRPAEFDVIATTNLNGDYLSDALAAQVGGIGIAPGANINYVTGHGIFEATHGTAPKYAGQDKVNPGLGPALGRPHVRPHRVDRRGGRHRAGPGGHHRRQGRHLRLRPADGGGHRGQVLGVRLGHRRPPLITPGAGASAGLAQDAGLLRLELVGREDAAVPQVGQPVSLSTGSSEVGPAGEGAAAPGGGHEGGVAAEVDELGVLVDTGGIPADGLDQRRLVVPLGILGDASSVRRRCRRCCPARAWRTNRASHFVEGAVLRPVPRITLE